MDSATTHLSEKDILRYRDREMLPAELISADSHLAQCDSCHRRLIDRTGLTDKVVGAAVAFEEAAAGETTPHLDFEQLSAFADNRLDDIDREVLQSHLDLCKSCESELNDLLQVSSRMTAWSERVGRKSSLREWMLAFRRPAFGLLA